MRRIVVLVVLLVAAVSASSAVAATTVKVSLKEFKVVLSTKTAKAGPVTFQVKNVGKIDHELVVVKTGAAAGKLPVKGGKANEKGSVGEVAVLKPGKGGALTRKLAKGKYVLLCNLAGHYQAGQFASFTVG